MNGISNILSDRVNDLFTDDQLTVAKSQTSLATKIEDEELPSVLNEHLQSQLDVTKLKTMIHAMKDQLDSMLRLINGEQVRTHQANTPDSQMLETGEKVIEGVFNGEAMIGPDGKEYSVPPNYASKSKMVEGDILKLTITNQGRFVFKQIGPTPRKRIVGELMSNEAGQWSVVVDGKPYKILNASVSFYKGQAGDQVVILVPEDGSADWGAVDNIIRSL